MAKVKQPLLSLDARRKLGDDIVFKRQGRTAIVETRPIPADARSFGQLSWRHMFQKVVALWHALSAAEKEDWESLGRKRHMTGYAWFVSQALRPNPGIYLPLQGGIMQGDIDMAKYRLLRLPLPTDSQEAASKAYVDAFSKVIWIDAPSSAMTDLNRVASLGWTDLDITAKTSADAKLALLSLWLRPDVVGTGIHSFLSVRKNGTTPSYLPNLIVNKAQITAGGEVQTFVIVGLDSGQVLEYYIYVATGWQIDTLISVLGYVE